MEMMVPALLISINLLLDQIWSHSQTASCFINYTHSFKYSKCKAHNLKGASGGQNNNKHSSNRSFSWHWCDFFRNYDFKSMIALMCAYVRLCALIPSQAHLWKGKMSIVYQFSNFVHTVARQHCSLYIAISCTEQSFLFPLNFIFHNFFCNL